MRRHRSSLAAYFAAAVHISCGSGAAGEGKDPLGSPAPAAESRPPKSKQKADVDAAPSREPDVELASVVLLENANKSRCHAIVASAQTLLTPSHCAVGVDWKVSHVPEAVVRKRGVVPAVDPLVEPFDVWFITWPSHAKVSAIPPLISAPRPDAIPLSASFPFLRASVNGPFTTKCRIVGYTRQKLLSYRCDTGPGDSGALLVNEEGQPMAIHLGQRNDLGYAVLLSALAEAFAPFSSQSLEVSNP
jgi:hypothetical protein